MSAALDTSSELDDTGAMDEAKRKRLGAYYTADAVVKTLVRWAVRSAADRMLDPSCGDGRFLAAHLNSVGIEQDVASAEVAHQRAPGSLIHQGDFFAWAAETRERFDCAAGNPPFIRYQRFAGEVRSAALRLCAIHGATFTSLASSWAPFLVATATLLSPGGRMAFVVPAEIGHAPYAVPVLEYLVRHFAFVQIVAVREKLFPDLSEDCWLLYAEGFGERTDYLLLSVMDQFGEMIAPPSSGVHVSVAEWRQWNSRLRPFLLSPELRALYRAIATAADTKRLGDVAKVGIGYVTGANEFFHLRPSEVQRTGIPRAFLRPAVRNGRALTGSAVTRALVKEWVRRDDPIFLLRLTAEAELPHAIVKYLDSAAGREARTSYKCRTRDPWYVVPDVTVPDAFLSYMSTNGPMLIANKADCVGTNSVHVVKLTRGMTMARLQKAWAQPLVQLSCELEGHPLGGGMLKLEPREAQRVVVPELPIHSMTDRVLVSEGIEAIRRWRHHAGPEMSDDDSS